MADFSQTIGSVISANRTVLMGNVMESFDFIITQEDQWELEEILGEQLDDQIEDKLREEFFRLCVMKNHEKLSEKSNKH